MKKINPKPIHRGHIAASQVQWTKKSSLSPTIAKAINLDHLPKKNSIFEKDMHCVCSLDLRAILIR